jgi:hypothetical protein
MFLGHYGLALAAKRAAPETSLGTLVLAAQWSDLLWPIFLLLGWERVAIVPGITRMTPLDFVHYPWSHSLIMVLVWALLLGAVAGARTGLRAGVVVGLCVASHWFLDLLVHRPDLPLAPGVGTRLGLGLWNSPWATVLLEAFFFVGGFVLYTRTTAPADSAGRMGFALWVGFLALIEIFNLGGSPPPSPQAVAWVTLLLWLLVPWAAWFDRHRPVRSGVR